MPDELYYKWMWDRLEHEMCYMQEQGVSQIAPIIVLGYMCFIRKLYSVKVEEDAEATSLDD